MTMGHKHIEVKVKNPRLIGFLRKPRYRTTDKWRVYYSPYPYTRESKGVYHLSLLGVLHRWTGLTLVVDP